MENTSLIIMVGGASSRMKRSLKVKDGHKGIMDNIPHKSLIPVGKYGKPFLYYLVQNAVEAGYTRLYLITSAENQAFQKLKDGGLPSGLEVFLAVQNVPAGRSKPLGTADALQQCLDQYPELKQTTFTVCNGDNLYSVGALKDLRRERTAPHALISYGSSGFEYTEERIAKFAVMNISSEGFLREIIEKPDLRDVPKYRDESGELRVSMNIFSFSGEAIYPYLKNCPIDPERDEKELPKAVAILVSEHLKSVLCIPRSEHIPDLTDANDIQLFKNLE